MVFMGLFSAVVFFFVQPALDEKIKENRAEEAAEEASLHSIVSALSPDENGNVFYFLFGAILLGLAYVYKLR